MVKRTAFASACILILILLLSRCSFASPDPATTTTTAEASTTTQLVTTTDQVTSTSEPTTTTETTAETTETTAEPTTTSAPTSTIPPSTVPTTEPMQPGDDLIAEFYRVRMPTFTHEVGWPAALQMATDQCSVFGQLQGDGSRFDSQIVSNWDSFPEPVRDRFGSAHTYFDFVAVSLSAYCTDIFG